MKNSMNETSFSSIYKQSLNCHSWRFKDCEPENGDASIFSAPDCDISSWHTISFPGDINAGLVTSECMPNPHYGDNARKCYWVTGREWWCRCEFQAEIPEECRYTQLCLDGVDSHAELFLNGTKLGNLQNAFRTYRFDVHDVIQADRPNVLLIRILSIDAVLGGPREDELAGWRGRRALMRKPQFSFGWDWALPLPSIGIMGGVWLESHSGPRLLDVSVKPNVSGRVDFKFHVNQAARDAGCHLMVRVRGQGVDLEKRIDGPSCCFSFTSLEIENPVLWWPHTMGEPNLYDYEVQLAAGGKVMERKEGRFGLREVCIVEEPFTPEAGNGISFWITVNGQRVFCKGANWVPLELWPAEAKPEQYRFYLHKAAEANMNMLRVWGGGIYERDLFYDLCDRLGIMVWQDFMFASTGYPVDLLREEIILEAKHQLRRLRNHPSIVLWCGTNEDVFSWNLPEKDRNVDQTADTGVYSETGTDLSVDRLRDDPQIYTMILRGLVSKMGLDVPYVESSPQSYGDAGNMPESGNSHLSCWKYALFSCRNAPEQFRRHFEQPVSFESEFCIQGPCNEESIRSFLPETHHWPPDDIWTYHIQKGHANLPHHEQTLCIAGGIFGKIDSLQKYVKHGQATHAEMMRVEFESARRDRPDNGGTMVWMYNDCWPTSNWSIIDYYQRPKPAYYAAKRACAPYLPIIFERKGYIELFFSNDTRSSCHVKLSFGQSHLDGSVVWSQEKSFVAEGIDTVRFHSLKRSAEFSDKETFLFIESSVDDMALPDITYFVDGWKDIKWCVPGMHVELIDQKREGDNWFTTLKLSAQFYGRFCHVIIPKTAGRYEVDDNFFDIRGGRSRMIAVRSERDFDADQVILGDWRTEWP